MPKLHRVLRAKAGHLLVILEAFGLQMKWARQPTAVVVVVVVWI